MQYRKLGSSGLKISSLSFGAWVTFGDQIGEKGACGLMAHAYDRGVNFFDNAEVYADGEAEVLMGKALRSLGWTRDTFCLSSKVFWGGEKPTQKGLSRKHVFDACHAALKRLQVEYLDLYFCHRPDPDTPIEETARAMHDLVAQGKILYWGTSEWTAPMLESAYAICDRLGLHPPSMEQPEYNLFRRERVEKELGPLVRERGLGLTTWSPLASGILTGKYSEGIPKGSRMSVEGYSWLRERLESPEGRARVDRAKEVALIAREIGATPAQLAIAWCLKNPDVSSVILGASRIEQLEENLGAAEITARIDAEFRARLGQAAGPG